jgi:hypothetical protein
MRSQWSTHGFCGLTAGFFLAALLLSACEKGDDSTIDPSGTPPFLRSAAVDPDSIPLNTLPLTNGHYGLSLKLTAQVVEGSLGVKEILVQVLPPSADTALVKTSLPMQGSASGVVSFAGEAFFNVPKSGAGAYRVSFQAPMEGNLESNTIIRTLILTRFNSPPVLSGLVAPDTVILPAGGSLNIRMTVVASDSDGLDDIQEVFFRSLDSSDPTKKYDLLDNGSSANGDAVAGDGVFSIIIQLVDSGNVRRTFRFAFQAVDSPGDTSATLLHSLTVE